MSSVTSRHLSPGRWFRGRRNASIRAARPWPLCPVMRHPLRAAPRAQESVRRRPADPTHQSIVRGHVLRQGPLQAAAPLRPRLAARPPEAHPRGHPDSSLTRRNEPTAPHGLASVEVRCPSTGPCPTSRRCPVSWTARADHRPRLTEVAPLFVVDHWATHDLCLLYTS